MKNAIRIAMIAIFGYPALLMAALFVAVMVFFAAGLLYAVGWVLNAIAMLGFWFGTAICVGIVSLINAMEQTIGQAVWIWLLATVIAGLVAVAFSMKTKTPTR